MCAVFQDILFLSLFWFCCCCFSLCCFSGHFVCFFVLVLFGLVFLICAVSLVT